MACSLNSKLVIIGSLAFFILDRSVRIARQTINYIFAYHCLRMMHGVHQWCPTVIVLRINIGTFNDKQFQTIIRTAMLRHNMQQCFTIFVFAVDFGTVFQKQFYNLCLIKLSASPYERRPALMIIRQMH